MANGSTGIPGNGFEEIIQEALQDGSVVERLEMGDRVIPCDSNEYVVCGINADADKLRQEDWCVPLSDVIQRHKSHVPGRLGLCDYYEHMRCPCGAVSAFWPCTASGDIDFANDVGIEICEKCGRLFRADTGLVFAKRDILRIIKCGKKTMYVSTTLMPVTVSTVRAALSDGSDRAVRMTGQGGTEDAIPATGAIERGDLFLTLGGKRSVPLTERALKGLLDAANPNGTIYLHLRPRNNSFYAVSGLRSRADHVLLSARDSMDDLREKTAE